MLFRAKTMDPVFPARPGPQLGSMRINGSLFQTESVSFWPKVTKIGFLHRFSGQKSKNLEIFEFSTTAPRSPKLSRGAPALVSPDQFLLTIFNYTPEGPTFLAQ